MRSFREMLDSKNDAELGAMMRDRYGRLMEAADMGLASHPAAQFNADNETLRAHSAAKDAAGSGLGSRELEETDQPGAQDDPPPTAGTPAAPERGAPAMDSVIRGYSRIFAQNRDKRVVDEDGIIQSVRSW